MNEATKMLITAGLAALTASVMSAADFYVSADGGVADGVQLRSHKDRPLPCRIHVTRPDCESRPRVDPETPRPLTPNLLPKHRTRRART